MKLEIRNPSQDSVVAAELHVLRAIAQGTLRGSVRDEAKLLLQPYRWRGPAHPVIFEVLLSIPSDDPEVIRDQLPARLTRRGFPDLPWERLFEPHRLSKEEVWRLIRQLGDFA